MSFSKYALGLSAGLIATASGAIAAEQDGPAVPPQAFDIRSAELPPMPGFYGGMAYGHRKVDAINDADGNSALPGTDVTESVIGFSGLYVLPDVYSGGRVGLYGALAFRNLEGQLAAGAPPLPGEWDPIDMIVGATWSVAQYDMPEGPPTGPPPGFVYSFGLQAAIPVGDASLGSVVISPHAAITYRTKPIFLDGTEFSARFQYNHVTERESDLSPGAKYKDGDYFAIDFAITERYRNFQFGLAGSYMKQIEDDVAGAGYVPPLPTVGGRMEELALGLVLNVDLGPTSAVKIRYTEPVFAKDISNGTLLGAQYVMKF